MQAVLKPDAAPPRYVGAGKLIHPKMTPLQAKQALYDARFNLLGMGASQAALSKKHGRRVVKLSAGKHTGGWDAIQMFMAHPEIEEFPRVYGVTELKAGAWAVEMERLHFRHLGVPEIGGDFDRSIWERIEEVWGHQVADAIEDTWGGYIDLHDANFMTRGNTPVIVDPFNDYSGISEVGATIRKISGKSREYGAEFWDNIKRKTRH